MLTSSSNFATHAVGLGHLLLPIPLAPLLEVLIPPMLGLLALCISTPDDVSRKKRNEHKEEQRVVWYVNHLSSPSSFAWPLALAWATHSSPLRTAMATLMLRAGWDH